MPLLGCHPGPTAAGARRPLGPLSPPVGSGVSAPLQAVGGWAVVLRESPHRWVGRRLSPREGLACHPCALVRRTRPMDARRLGCSTPWPRSPGRSWRELPRIRGPWILPILRSGAFWGQEGVPEAAPKRPCPQAVWGLGPIEPPTPLAPGLCSEGGTQAPLTSSCMSARDLEWPGSPCRGRSDWLVRHAPGT